MVNIKKYKEPNPEEIYKDYEHFLGANDIDGNIITEERLYAWAKDPNRDLICIFCGSEPVDRGGFIYCQRCKEYKGVMPNCPNI